MTREEAYRILSNGLVNAPSEHDWCMAFEMAIKALEQNERAEEWYKLFVEKFESCEDAISREAVIDNFWKLKIELRPSAINVILDMINKLPSVQPSRKEHWIDYRDDGFVECPFCGHATNCEDNIDELHYCFYCGARMVEPQESEEQTE